MSLPLHHENCVDLVNYFPYYNSEYNNFDQSVNEDDKIVIDYRSLDEKELSLSLLFSLSTMPQQQEFQVVVDTSEDASDTIFYAVDRQIEMDHGFNSTLRDGTQYGTFDNQRETSNSTIVSQHDDDASSSSSVSHMNSDTESDDDGEESYHIGNLEQKYDHMNIVKCKEHHSLISKFDVLLGRGGHCANHIGNKRFLRKRNQLYQKYRSVNHNTAKRDVQTQLIQSVWKKNGRFLAKAEDKILANDNITYWNVVTDDRKIHRKAAQALREGYCDNRV